MRKLLPSRGVRSSDGKGSATIGTPAGKTAISVGLGITTLAEPTVVSEAVVDIVLVHGLQGGSDRTWLHEESGVYWPVDFLSHDVPRARILAFGYDVEVVNLRGPASQNRISNHATNLLGELSRLREKTATESRRIVFVAHSLGGLVTQDALCISKASSERHLQQIGSSTAGVLFLGTPHCGSDHAAWGALGVTFAKLFKRANLNIVSVLMPNSETLARIQEGFHTLLRERGDDLAVTCFYEELPLTVGGMVVELNSAIIPGHPKYGMHANHQSMTKFPDRNDKGYSAILGELKRCVKGSPSKHVSIIDHAKNHLFTVPFDRDPKFIGRSNALQQIKGQHTLRRRVALAGIGGVGKSQVAIEYAYRFRDENPDSHVVWVHCSSRGRFLQAYQEIARKLDLLGCDDPQTDTARLVFDWFGADVHGPWLMILDNADDLELLFQSPEPSSPVSTLNLPLANLIPRAQRGSILVTTRDKRLGQRLIDRQMPIVLLPMDFKEAKDLFESQLQLEAGYENHDILGLLEALEYLPLAITQAVAFINENSTTISGYLELLGADDAEIQALLDEDHGDHRRDFESASSVIRTWKLSFDLISKQKPLAARILSLMALLDRQGIPKSLIKGDDDRDFDVTTALGTLQAFFLVHVGKGGETYELHRLVQLAMQRWLESNGIKEEMQRDAMFLIADRFPAGSFETWTECEELVPHASKVVQYKYTDEASKLRYALLLRKMAYYEAIQGRYDNAYTRGTAALELQEKLLGSEDQQTLVTMGIVAHAIHKLGRWKDAEKLNSRRVEIAMRVRGPEDHFTLRSMMDLGRNFERMCRYSDAEELLVSVAKTYRRLYGLEDIYTVEAMEELSTVYIGQSRYKEAEGLEMHVLATRKRLLGPQHPSTSASMSHLATLHERQGRYEDAEKLALDVLQTTREMFPGEHARVLTSSANVARLYASQGRLQEAEELFLSVLEANKKVLGTEHPQTLRTMHNLASTYGMLGRAKAAQTLYEELLEREKRVLGPQHGDTLMTMQNLALNYKDQDRDYEAIDLVQAVVEGRTNVLGADSPDTLFSKHKLAFLYQRQGRLDEAKALYEEVLECRKRVLGAEHREALTIMNNLAFIYHNQNRHDEAIGLMQAVVEGRINILGVDSPDTLSSKQSLAFLYQQQGRLDEAKALYEEVLKCRKRVLGAQHRDTLTTMNNLALIYQDQDRRYEAIDLMRAVVEGCIKTVGSDHEKTLRSIDCLKGWTEARTRAESSYVLATGRDEVGSSAAPGTLSPGSPNSPESSELDLTFDA